MYRGAESDDTQAKRRHIRVNVWISGSLVNSPHRMSSLCLARPLKRWELPAISVVTTAVFRGAKRRHAKPFIAHQVQQSLSDKKIKAIYIDPGSPWLPSDSDTSTSDSENNKRFHRVVSQPITRCTEERSDDIAKRSCLNPDVLLSVAEAQVVIEQWRQTYNHDHPHSRLGFKSPQEFVRFLSDLGRVRATPSLRQDLSYTSILKPLIPGNSLT